jgi:energy-coupling factor transporter ATP-binding protein EcfA2
MQVENLLQQCTVKLSIPGQVGWGTGFFVAPGLILTCAHVVQDLVEPNRVRVRWQQQVEFAEAELAQRVPELDLALLKFVPGDADLPCVCLDEGLQVGQDLYFFGYPDTDFEDGCPVTGSCEGFTGDVSPLIKFKQAQVRPGISGSALLNQQTQKVCGMVKFTRDRSFDLGGGAIPTHVILESFPQLRELQKEFHRQDLRWRKCIDTVSDINWHNICYQMLIQQQKITSDRFNVGGNFELEELYVPLGLVEKQSLKNRDKDVSPELGSQLYQEETVFSITHDRFFENLREQGIKPKRIVLTGEPGSGKTTLLQKIAFWILENNLGLPIWVPLGLVETTLSNYLTESWLGTAIANVTSETKRDLERLCNEGQVWLLLDGLDERSDPTESRFINSLQSGWLIKAQMVLSSRLNIWEVAQNYLNWFQTYRNLDFEEKQLKQFINNYFAKIENLASGERLLYELSQPGKERIKNLTKNPLCCFLMCRSWQVREGALPDTKFQLYNEFVKAIYQWRRYVPQSFSTYSAAQRELNIKLGQLAQRAIDEEKTRFILKHDFVSSILGELDEPLFRLALDLGWLNIVGKDSSDPLNNVYAFCHPTFQEYFAGLAVDDWDFFLPRNHNNEPVVGKPYRIFEPQWKEVILLWLGRQSLSNQEKDDFLNRLIEFDDGCSPSTEIGRDESFYRTKNYFLAAEGIDEYRGFNASKEIDKKLISWCFGYIDDNTGTWMKYVKPFEERAIDSLLKIEKTRIISALECLIMTTEKNTIINRKAVEVLKSVDPQNCCCQDSLVDILDTKDFKEPKINTVVKVEIPTPLQKLSGWQESINVSLSLGRLDLGAYEIDSLKKISLENICNYSQQNYLRFLAAISLSQIDVVSHIAVKTFEDLIRNLQNTYTLEVSRRRLDYLKRNIASYKQKRVLNKAANEFIINTISDETILSANDYDFVCEVEKFIGSRDVYEMAEEKIDKAGYLLILDSNNSVSIDYLLKIITHATDVSHVKRAEPSLSQVNLNHRQGISILEIISEAYNTVMRSTCLKSGVRMQPSYNNSERLKGEKGEVLRGIITRKLKEEINPNNSLLIPALEKLLTYCVVNEDKRFAMDIANQIKNRELFLWSSRDENLTADTIERIRTGNSTINQFKEYLGIREPFFSCFDINGMVNILMRFDPKQVLDYLLTVFKCTQDIDNAIDVLQRIKFNLSSDQIPKVVASLKDDFLIDNWNINSVLLSEKYEIFRLISETLSYKEFYRIWHGISNDS